MLSLSALCLPILPRLALLLLCMPSFLGEFHSLGESWACNRKTSQKWIHFVHECQAVPNTPPPAPSFSLNHHLFFITLVSLRGGHTAVEWPWWVSTTCYDPMCPKCPIKWEWACNEHFMYSNTAYILCGPHINVAAHISISCLRLPWLFTATSAACVQMVPRAEFWICNNCSTNWKA